MQTREIPTHEWVPFLDDFSRRHRGQPVTIEILAPEVGPQREADALPLAGVSVDVSDGGDNEQIEVMAGDSPHAHVMHAVRRPSRVRVACGDDGADAALQLESLDGTVTLVKFLA